MSVFSNIGTVCGITTILSFMFSFVDEKCLVGLVALPFAIVFLLLASILSKVDKYTDKFMEHIRKRLDGAITLEEHLSILEEFKRLAIDNGKYVLSYPASLKILNKEIGDRILILNKQVK